MIDNLKITQWIAAIFVAVNLAIVPRLSATNYTWTNTTADSSGEWTNGVLWRNAGSLTFPGSPSGDSAFLTNQFSGTATNILDASLPNSINSLAISNASGEAWLIVTNAVLNDATFALGAGGRLQIDSGGVVTGITSFTWAGNSGTLWLDNGGKLFTSSAVTIGNGISSVNATVNSLSGPGLGGLWNFNSQNLTVGSGVATGNVLTVNNAVLTNLGVVVVGTGAASSSNSLVIQNGASFSSGALTVGIAGSGLNQLTISNATLSTGGLTIGAGTTNNSVSVLANSLWNMNGGSLTIGSGNPGFGISNTLTVDGSVITNIRNQILVGGAGFGNANASFSSLLITNGGQIIMPVTSNDGQIYVGVQAGSNNLMTITGAGSVLKTVGGTGSSVNIGGGSGISNGLIIANGGKLLTTGFGGGVGNGSGSNFVLVTDPGSIWSNFTAAGGSGVYGVGINNSGNRMVVSNGGAVYFLGSQTFSLGAIGSGAAAQNNSVLVTGTGSVYSNNADLTIGAGGSGNRLTVANGGRAFVDTYQNGSVIGTSGSNNVVTVTDPGSVWQVNYNGSLGAINLGQTGGQHNQLIISNGASVLGTFGPFGGGSAGALIIGGAAGASNNSVLITGSTLSNAATINVGSTGAGYNTLTGLNSFVFSKGLNIGANLSSSNTVYVDNTAWNFRAAPITVGSALGSGAGGASGNQLIVSTAGTYGLTNIGGINLYDRNASYVFTNRNLTTGGGINLGASGLGNNSLTLSNQSYTSGAGSLIGNGSSNNVLTILGNTLWNGGAQNITVGNNAATGNVLLVNGGVVSNAGFVFVGGGTASGNSVIVTNGGVLYSSNVQFTGLKNSATVTGAGSVWSNGAFSWMGGAYGGDSLTISAGGKFVIGVNYLFVGYAGTVSNAVTVTGPGSSMLINGTLDLGSWAGNENASFNSVVISNGGAIVATVGFVLGAGNGNNSNTLLVTDPGSTMTNANLYTGQGNGVGNSVVITNGGKIIDSALDVIGFGNGASNSVLVSGSGSVWSNTGTLYVSLYGNYSTLTIAGGGRAVSAGASLGNVGNGSGGYFIYSASNTVTVTDPGSVWQLNGALYVGGNPGTSFSNSFYNSVIVTNGGLVNSASAIIGAISNADYNTVLITGAGSTWSNSSTLVIGNPNAWGNSLNVTNGGAYYGNGLLNVGLGAGATNNTLNASGGTVSNNGLVVVGSTGSSFNLVNVTNANVWSKGLTVGTNASNNAVNELPGANWNLMAQSVAIGAGTATGNVVNLSGGAFSNVGLVNIGVLAGAVSNGLVINNGSTFSSGNLTVGASPGANNNYFNINGATSSNGLITIGAPGSGFNAMLATNANLQSQGLSVGSGSSNNTVTVRAGTTWDVLGQPVTIGSLAATGNVFNINGLVLNNGATITVGSGKAGSPNTNSISNSMIIGNGGTLMAGAVKVGNVIGDNNNAVQVINGGLLEANTLTVLAGSAGNTISNVNAIYQFTTATPAVTPNGFGNIAINSGTISFRGIDNADVTANQAGGALSGISFSGNNTFMLNAASNFTASAVQDYTFQVVPGNPSNYVNLVMVNGQTEYNGNLIIGASGTLLISNTVAGIDQPFANQGTTVVVNATATFQSTIANHGLLNLQNATLNTTLMNFGDGTIRGNGTISDNVNNLGTISPVGTLTFAGNLSLGGSSKVIMELTGYGNGVGTNDVIDFGGGVHFGGTLTVTNTTGFAFAYGERFQIFDFTGDPPTGFFSVTNLPALTTGLLWDTSQLDTNGLLIVVPEPSTILLLAVGALMLRLLIHAKRRTCKI